jgi:hypothetical protein
MRYNMVSATLIIGALLPGVSTGDILATVERLGRELSRNVVSGSTELSCMQKQSSVLAADELGTSNRQSDRSGLTNIGR